MPPSPVLPLHTVPSSEGVASPLASSDVLRCPKSVKRSQLTDSYRSLLPEERKQPRFRLYLARVGQHF